MAGAQHGPELAPLLRIHPSGQIRPSHPPSLAHNPSPAARVWGAASSPSPAHLWQSPPSPSCGHASWTLPWTSARGGLRPQPSPSAAPPPASRLRWAVDNLLLLLHVLKESGQRSKDGQHPSSPAPTSSPALYRFEDEEKKKNLAKGVKKIKLMRSG